MQIIAEDAATFLKIGMILWVFLLMAAVLYRVLIKAGAFREMMTGPSGRMDPERVATFLIIFGIAGYYTLTASQGSVPFDAETESYWMPDIPETLLIILAGGKTAFLAGKISRGLNRS